MLFQQKDEEEGLSDSNGIRTHNHLARKRTLNHLTKLTKWLSCVVSTYLYSECHLNFRYHGQLNHLASLAKWFACSFTN